MISSKPSKNSDGPRGSTALYDATGSTIKAVEDNRYGAEKIIVVICTDGQENSSREWTKDSLHASIDAKIAAGDWTFTYLGTQPETWDDAGAIGMAAGTISSYVATNAAAAYGLVGQAVNSMSRSAVRGSANMLQNFSTRKQRLAADMKTGQDNADDNAAVGQIPPTTPKFRPTAPKPQKNKITNRSWK